MTDIDIDFPDPGKALSGLRHVVATMVKDDGRYSHASGMYFQAIPVDPLDGMAAWDYKTAAERGYFKLDFLVNTIYRPVRDENHLVTLLATDPPWACFQDQVIVDALAHIRGHFKVVQQIAPKSIPDLAVCIALIRPGKAHLIGRPRAEIDREIWTKTDKFAFKKAHALSYAASIVVQLNLMIEALLEKDSGGKLLDHP